MIPERRFRGVVQLLQADPENYKAFGVYWWSVKRMLKEHYDTKVLYLLGSRDDASTRTRVEAHYRDDEALFRAAMHHYGEVVRHGETTLGSSSFPDGDEEPYILEDGDAGPANAP